MRRYRFITCLGLGLASVIIACLPQTVQTPPVPHGATISDSAGVQVLRWSYPDTTAPPLWELPERPAVEIGGYGTRNGPYHLERVVAAVRSREGFAVAANAGTEIRLFDESGRYFRTLGLSAGEIHFRTIRGLAQMSSGDFFVFDLSQGALAVDSNGGLVERYRSQGLWLASVLSNGVGVATTVRPGESAKVEGNLIWTNSILGRMDLRGGQVTEIVRFPGAIWCNLSTGGRRDVPWSPRMNYRTNSHQIAAGWTGAPAVKVFNADGQLTHIVRWKQQVEFFSPGELEAFINEFPEDRREEVRVLVDSMPGGMPRPSFRGIYIDEQGNLWVGTERSSPTPVHRYLKFALDGSESGYVDLPGRPRLSVISDREVLGLWWEEGASVLRAYHVGSGAPR